MKLAQQAKMVLESGIVPLRLVSERLVHFDDDRRIRRTSLWLESLDLGVLTPAQYRFVARRSKRGDELVERHIAKVFVDFPALAGEDVACVTLPAFPRVLLNGALSKMLFAAFAAYPSISPAKIGVELSADILFEDQDEVKRRLKDLKQTGVKLLISEVGEEFCPTMRMAELPFDYALADAFVFADGDEGRRAGGLAALMHLYGVEVFASAGDETTVARARAAGFDGYLTEVSEL